MPQYFFHLKDGGYGYCDTSGVNLPNTIAAIHHSRQIAADLLKNREGKVRHWRVHVHDAEGRQIHESRLIDQDETFKCLDTALQERVKQFCRRCHELQDTIESAQRTKQQSGMLMARSRHKPYLVVG